MRRFWDKVNKRGRYNMRLGGRCWEWTAHTKSLPPHYGTFRFKGRTQVAHRVSWILVNGEIPRGRYCLHKCDNGRCVNPDHLYLGTLKDNANDRDRRNRQTILRGDDCPTSVLPDSDIKKIRELYKTGDYSQAELGRIFGVDRRYVHDVVRGKSRVLPADTGHGWRKPTPAPAEEA